MLSNETLDVRLRASHNPQYTPTDVAMDSEWVKIVPNTDTALFLAISYHAYTTGKHDQAYLDKYTVSFDKFLPYLLGKDADGTPAKTPEWAAAITGIPAQKIIEMAELFASKRTQFALGWSLQRAHHGEMPHWAAVNMAAILGKIGKPGEGVGFSWHYGGAGMPQSTKVIPIGIPQGRNLLTTRCPASRISEMLLNPGKKYTRDGTEDIFPDVKLVYTSGNNVLSHQQDTNELLRALNQQVQTFICQGPWWCASSRFADIVLPATSALERDDMSSGGTYGNDKIYAMRKVIEPYEESLDDFEIFKRLHSQMANTDLRNEEHVQFDLKGRCNSGSINLITTSIAASGLSQATRAFNLKGATLGSMTPGEQLFYGRCALCHVAREPGDYTMSQWMGITQSMFPRAGLTDDEKKLVLEFLAVNAKDAVSK